jgi:hypothetical protein
MIEYIAPEHLEVHTLPWFPIEQYHALPHCPALYFVLNADNSIVYIGRTVSLKRRWAHHHRLQDYATLPGMKLAWLFVSDTVLLPALEAACIAHFRPRDNRRPGRPKSDVAFQSYTVMLPPWLHEWAMQHPEGLSGLVRRLLLEAHAASSAPSAGGIARPPSAP